VTSRNLDEVKDATRSAATSTEVSRVGLPVSDPGLADPGRPSRLGGLRRAVVRLPFGRLIWRTAIGFIGLVVIVTGIILLPLPGPGWLIIFLGLAIWGTEFEWAKRLLRFARAQVERWTGWLLARPRWIQLAVGVVGLIFLGGVLFGSWWLVRQI
jgi:uncharacterized protein (TIGR02611 family)